jgi:hypothetical protein
MGLMAAISASSAGAVPPEMGDELDRLRAGAPGQLPYAQFEGVRTKFIAAIKAQRGGGVPCTE